MINGRMQHIFSESVALYEMEHMCILGLYRMFTLESWSVIYTVLLYKIMCNMMLIPSVVYVLYISLTF